jgi:hypothetical protein
VKIHQFRRAFAIPFGERIDEADVIALPGTSGRRRWNPLASRIDSGQFPRASRLYRRACAHDSAKLIERFQIRPSRCRTHDRASISRYLDLAGRSFQTSCRADVPADLPNSARGQARGTRSARISATVLGRDHC